MTMSKRKAAMAGASVGLAFLYIFLEPLFSRLSLFPPVDGSPYYRYDSMIRALQFLWGRWRFHAIGWGEGGDPLVPTTLLAILLPPLTFHLFRYIFDTVLLGLATAFFLRGRGFRGASQWLPAVGMALSGYTFTLISAGHAFYFDMMPFAILGFACLDRGFRRRSVFWFAWVGVCGAFGIARQPDVLTLFGLLWVAYSLFLLFENRPSPGTRQTWAKYARILALGVFASATAFAAVGASAFARLTLVHEIREDVRGKSPQQQWEFATNWSMPPEELLDMVAPFVYGIETGDSAGPYWGRLGRSMRWRETRQGLMNLKQHTLYMGLIPLIFGLYAALRLWGAKHREDEPLTELGLSDPARARKEAVFWSIAFATTVILAMGRYTPFYRLFYTLPFFSKIRAPVKFIHLSEWALAVLFAYGLALFLKDVGRVFGGREKEARSENPPCRAEKGGRRNAKINHGEHGAHGKGARGSANDGKSGKKEREDVRRWLLGFGIGCAALGFVFLFASGIVPGFEPLRTYWKDIGFAQHADLLARTMRGGFLRATLLSFVAAAAFAWPLFSKRSVAAFVAAVLWVAVLADMATVGRRYVRVGDVSPWYNRNPVADAILADPEIGRTAFHLGPTTWRNWICGSLLHHGVDILQYTVGDFPPPDIYQRFFATFQKNPVRLWEIANARYLIGAREQFAPLLEHPAFQEVMSFDLRDGRYMPADRNGPYVLVRFVGAMARASLIGDWQYVEPDEALNKLADPDWNPRQKAWISSPAIPPSPARANGPTGAARIVRYGRTRIDIETQAAEPALLLLKDKYDPDWRATVNGEPADLLRCNYLMRGVMVPPGKSVVRFTYRPNLPWLLTSLAGIVFMLGWSGWRCVLCLKGHPILKSSTEGNMFRNRQETA